MNGYYKEGHERLKEVVSLHHNAIQIMLGLTREKLQAETEFWTSLIKELEQEVKNGNQQQE